MAGNAYEHVIIRGMSETDLQTAKQRDRSALWARVAPVLPLGIAGIILLPLRFMQAGGGLFAVALLIVAAIITIMLFNLGRNFKKLERLEPGDLWRGIVNAPDNYGGVMVVRDDGLKFISTSLSRNNPVLNAFEFPASGITEIQLGGKKWGGAMGWRLTEVAITTNSLGFDVNTTNWLFKDPVGFCAALRKAA